MGELGIALSDKDYLSFMNPAGLNELRLTRFETGFIYSGVDAQNSASSIYHTRININGMMAGFPLDSKHGISFSFGLLPYSDVGYDVVTTHSDPLVKDYSATYSGKGGLSKFTMGGSYRLPFNFSVGLTYDYYFGRIEANSSATFLADSSLYNASFHRENSYHGMGMTAGLISNDLSKIFNIEGFREFRIGLVYSPSVTLSVDSMNYVKSVISTVQTATGSVKMNLPYKLGVGTAFNLFSKYTFTLDYLFQPFTQFTSNNKSSSNLQDYYKMSLGFEYRDAESRSDEFWDRVMYRAGISYEQSQYKINGTGIDQYSIYAGLAFPIAFDNTIDLGFQYGRRGTTDNSLLRENIFKFNVTVSLGELWFLQTDR